MEKKANKENEIENKEMAEKENQVVKDKNEEETSPNVNKR